MRTIVIFTKSKRFAAISMMRGHSTLYFVGSFDPRLPQKPIHNDTFSEEFAAMNAFQIAVGQTIQNGWQVVYHGQPKIG